MAHGDVVQPSVAGCYRHECACYTSTPDLVGGAGGFHGGDQLVFHFGLLGNK